MNSTLLALNCSDQIPDKITLIIIHIDSRKFISRMSIFIPSSTYTCILPIKLSKQLSYLLSPFVGKIPKCAYRSCFEGSWRLIIEHDETLHECMYLDLENIISLLECVWMLHIAKLVMDDIEQKLSQPLGLHYDYGRDMLMILVLLSSPV